MGLSDFQPNRRVGDWAADVAALADRLGIERFGVLDYSASPWDFDPAQIRMPVRLWQGERDRNAPPAMVRRLAATIPRSDVTFFPDEGHISVMAHHVGEVLAALVA